MMFLIPIFPFMPYIFIFAFLAGLCEASISIVYQTFLQINSSSIVRGKVFSLAGAMLRVIVPIAMSFAGILGDIFPVKNLLILSFLIPFVLILSILLLPRTLSNIKIVMMKAQELS